MLVFIVMVALIVFGSLRLRSHTHKHLVGGSNSGSGSSLFRFSGSGNNDYFHHDSSYRHGTAYASMFDSSVSSSSNIEFSCVNPSTGCMMIGGVGGIDACGHTYGN
jgi:hypothetical protein